MSDIQKHRYGRGHCFDWDMLRADVGQGFKYCTKCGQKKQIDDYSKRKKYPLGMKSQCKQCDAVDFNKWHTDNIEKARQNYRKSHYKKKYGLSEKESLILSDPENRKGICPICQTLTMLVLDHHHKSGKIRELICSSCNSLLGYAKESESTLFAAIRYLEKHRG